MGTVSVPMATTALSALELGVNYPYIDGVGGCHEVLVLRAQRTAARTCCRRRAMVQALAEERRMKGELS
jgi:hypothetical protein